MLINYSDLPGFDNLFLDYLYEFDNVRKFFNTNFRNINNYDEVFTKVKNSIRVDRKKLTDIIANQYKDFKISKQTESNIASLSSNKSLAVVTGQQLSLFGGPLYTFYKTITAIKLSQQLKEKYEQYNFIPVFWMEGDDHDFEEVKSVNIFNGDNGIENIIYDDGLELESNRGSVGNLKFNEQLEKTLNKVKDSLRETEFTNDLISQINKAYSVGKSFKEAFKEILFNLFDEYGLIIFDPQDAEVKKLLHPIFKYELENFRKNTDIILERSAELEEVYHAQVKIKPINLFLSESDGRFLIEPVDDNFRLKGKRLRYSLEHLLSILDSSPQRFSPNVLLRPICQDYLFPSACYIAGPSEISYFAQVMPYYSIFNIQQPIIYPRASITIIEKNIKTILEKYDLDLMDLFTDEHELISGLIAKIGNTDVKDVFNHSFHEIEKTIDNLKENIYVIDQTLIDAANKSKERIIQTLENLQTKVEKAQERQHETVIRQVQKARMNLYPNSNFQEREINFTYFANKYGIEIVKWVFNEISISKFEHQVLEL